MDNMRASYCRAALFAVIFGCSPLVLTQNNCSLTVPESTTAYLYKPKDSSKAYFDPIKDFTFDYYIGTGNSSNVPVNHVAYFICHSDCTLIGAPSVMCTNDSSGNAKWNAKFPDCKQNYCSRYHQHSQNTTVEFRYNGKKLASNAFRFPNGTKLIIRRRNVSCAPSSKLKSTKSTMESYCLRNSSWSDPNCTDSSDIKVVNAITDHFKYSNTALIVWALVMTLLSVALIAFIAMPLHLRSGLIDCRLQRQWPGIRRNGRLKSRGHSRVTVEFPPEENPEDLYLTISNNGSVRSEPIYDDHRAMSSECSSSLCDGVGLKNEPDDKKLEKKPLQQDQMYSIVVPKSKRRTNT